VRLANLRDEKNGLKWLRSKFPDVLEAESRTVVAVPSVSPKVYRPGTPEHDELVRKSWLIPLRDTLRVIWRTPDVKSKQWGLFRISQDFFLQGDPHMIRRSEGRGLDFLLSWKPPTRTELFLLALMEWADFLRYCNNEDCPAPYFIATKRTQKYCSRDCAKPFQQEAKRRWWATTGRQRRSAKKG
jgi:hypothetical protein